MIHLITEAYNRRQYSTTSFDTALFFANLFNGRISGGSGSNYIITI